MFNLKKVEDWQPNPADASELKLKGTNYYIRLKSGDEGPYYICDGHVYVDGGHQVPKSDLPDWFWDQVKMITRESLEAARSLDILKHIDSPSKK